MASFLRFWIRPIHQSNVFISLKSCVKSVHLTGRPKLFYQYSKYRSNSQLHSLPFEVDTNVPKDVLLFKCDNDRFFRLLTVFGIAQFLFWTYLSTFAYSTLRDVEKKTVKQRTTEVNDDKLDTGNDIRTDYEKLSWWQTINLGKNVNRIGIALFCGVLGYGILFGSFFYCLRSVHALHLLKGGESVRVTTYGVFGRKRPFVKPLTDISSYMSRQVGTTTFPLKIRGRPFYYLLDARKGEFYNTKLFDYSIGMRRSWKKV